MRGIKFRAWDKEKGTMHKVEEITFHEDGSISGLLEDGRGRYYFNQRVLVDGDYIDDVVLMQYTGVKNKSGREIYEGDIYHHGDINIKYIVEWVDAGFKGRQNGNRSYAGLGYWQDQIEVIGNIYENPELLEV